MKTRFIVKFVTFLFFSILLLTPQIGYVTPTKPKSKSNSNVSNKSVKKSGVKKKKFRVKKIGEKKILKQKSKRSKKYQIKRKTQTKTKGTFSEKKTANVVTQKKTIKSKIRKPKRKPHKRGKDRLQRFKTKASSSPNKQKGKKNKGRGKNNKGERKITNDFNIKARDRRISALFNRAHNYGIRVKDGNSMHHIFEKPGRNFESFLGKYHSKEAAYRAINEAANKAWKDGKLKVDRFGSHQGKVSTINVNGMKVKVIGGKVIRNNFVVVSASRDGLP